MVNTTENSAENPTPTPIQKSGDPLQTLWTNKSKLEYISEIDKQHQIYIYIKSSPFQTSSLTNGNHMTWYKTSTGNSKCERKNSMITHSKKKC